MRDVGRVHELRALFEALNFNHKTFILNQIVRTLDGRKNNFRRCKKIVKVSSESFGFDSETVKKGNNTKLCNFEKKNLSKLDIYFAWIKC